MTDRLSPERRAEIERDMPLGCGHDLLAEVRALEEENRRVSEAADALSN